MMYHQQVPPAGMKAIDYHQRRLLEPNVDKELQVQSEKQQVDEKKEGGWLSDAFMLTPLPIGWVRCYDEQGKLIASVCCYCMRQESFSS